MSAASRSSFHYTDLAAANSPALDFPGCVATRLTSKQYDACERHVEFWDASTETAWVVPLSTAIHEYPGYSLASLATRIASVRGWPIKCYGTIALKFRDECGRRLHGMEPD